MAAEWVAPVLSFVGAGAGAVAGYVAVIRQIRSDAANTATDVGQRREQARHEEWGRRFTQALEGIGSDDPRRRALARVLLVHLAKHGGDDTERALADTVLRAGALLEADGDLLDAPRQGVLVDNIRFEEDNEDPTEGAP